MQLEALYQEIILDHYKHPHGRGLREPTGPDGAACQVGEAHHVNPTCGDEITVRVAVDGEVFTDVSYDGMGCSISQASASVLHESLRGADAGAAAKVHQAFVELMSGRGEVTPDEDLLGDGVAFAGVAKFPARVKCALLPWMAFKDAAARAGIGMGPRATSTAGGDGAAGSAVNQPEFTGSKGERAE